MPAPAPTGRPPAPAEWLRIATWNLNLLHWRTGGAVWRGAPARRNTDYRTLARYARNLNADVIAFQEVNGPRAAARVFPPRDYSLHISGRHDPRYDDIYNGFAVRKGRFDRVVARSYAALGIGSGSRYSLRWGVDLTVSRRRAEASSAQRPSQVQVLLQEPQGPPRPALPQARPAGRPPRILDRRPLARRCAVRGAGRLQPRIRPARAARPPVARHRRRRPVGTEAPPDAGRAGVRLLARHAAPSSAPESISRVRRTRLAAGGQGVIPAGGVDRSRRGRPPRSPVRSLARSRFDLF